MGEYTNSGAKMGTCEDMYYLRADQRHLVSPDRGSVHPDTVGLRFRFPWPDEDNIPPCGGEFHDNGYDRAIAVDVPMPEGVEHYSVQFVAHAGYLTSLPCPEGPDRLQNLTIHRNGFSGAVKLVRQKLLEDGRLVPVCMCGGCGAMWRVENPAEIEALAVAFRSEGDRRERMGEHNGTGAADRRFWDQIADRILLGARLVPDEVPA